MKGFIHFKVAAIIAAMALPLILTASQADARVFVGIGVGVPVYSGYAAYPYPAYPYPYPYYAPQAVYAPAQPPIAPPGYAAYQSPPTYQNPPYPVQQYAPAR